MPFIRPLSTLYLVLSFLALSLLVHILHAIRIHFLEGLCDSRSLKGKQTSELYLQRNGFFLLVEKKNWDEKPCAKAIRQIYSNDKIQ